MDSGIRKAVDCHNRVKSQFKIYVLALHVWY